MEAELLAGPYAYTAVDAAAAIGLSLAPLDPDPPAGRARLRLTPVWEGEQVAESPYQRFIQVGALSCALLAVCPQDMSMTWGEWPLTKLGCSSQLCMWRRVV